MKKFYFVALLFLVYSSCIQAQQLPIFANYVFDPYLYNPAYIAQNGFSEINLVHRRQWVDIDNAPVITAINAQILLNPRLALGVNIINDESVLLNRTSGVFTLGYKVPLSSSQRLSFGLSAGATYQRLDLTGVETVTDPALANAETNNIGIDGQFGIVYSWNKLTLGFSLPRLFVTDPNPTESFGDVEFSELNNQILTASYKIELSPFFTLQPLAQYRFTQDDLNFFDVAALVNYKNLVTLGASYRENSGPGLMFQIRANEMFDVSYAHEFATSQDLTFAGATHEIHLKLRLGKKKPDLVLKDRPQKANPIDLAKLDEQPTSEVDSTVVEQIAEAPKDTLASTKPEIETPKDEPDRTVTEKVIEEEIEVESKDQNIEPAINNISDTKPAPITSMTTGYYLVVGSFHSKEYAQSFFKEVIKLYPASELGYDENTDFYFIYTEKVDEAGRSVDIINEIRENSPYKDAWFKRIK